MALTERLALLISADVDGAVRGLEKVGRSADRNLGLAEAKLERTSARMKKFGAGALGAAGLAAAGLFKAGQAASDLEQAVGGTEAVFGEASGAIEKFAKSAADNMGLSEREFREATTSIGGQLKRMTGDVDLAAEQSVRLTGVAADLAATYGGTTAEAVNALGAAFRGEADPAERFNLNLKASVVNAKAVELGLAASTSEVSENARAQAILATILEQSADAQGRFALEADTAAGAMQRASGNMENAMASLGESVAPIIADVADALSGVAGGFARLNESTGGAVGKFALYATAATGALGATSLIAAKIIDLNRGLRDTDGNLTRAGRGVSVFGKALGALGVGLLAVEMYQMAQAARQMDVDITAAAKATDEELLSAFRRLRDFDPGTELEFFGKVAESNIGTARRLRDALAALGEDTSALDAAIADAVMGERQLAADSDAAADAVGGLGDATDDAAGSVGGYTTHVEDWADAQKEANGAVQDAIDGLKDLSKELKAQFDPLFGLLDAQNDLADAQLEVVAAEKEHGKNSKEYERALQALAGATVDFEGASLDLAAAVEAGDVSLDTAADTLNRWADQGFITGRQAAELAARFGLVVDQADDIANSNPTFRVRAEGVDEAIAALQRLGAAIAIVDGGTGTITTRVQEDDGRVSVDSAFFMQSGGPVPGPKGEPVLGTAHGGEFILSADVVDAIKRGQSTIGLGGASPMTGSAQSSGPALHIENFYASDRPTIDELDQAARRQQLMAM